MKYFTPTIKTVELSTKNMFALSFNGSTEPAHQSSFLETLDADGIEEEQWN